MAPTRVYLDLTPWVRGPFTGIGRSAVELYRGLRGILEREKRPRFELVPVQRGPAVTREEIDIDSLGRLRAFLGEPRAILHTFDHKMPVFWRGRRVMTYHDAWTLVPNDFQSEAFRTRQAAVQVASLRRSDRIVTPTAAVIEELRRFEPLLAERASFAHWGADRNEDEIEAPVSSEERAFLRALPKRFVALVGVVEVRKNLPYAVRALVDFDDLHVVVIGRSGFGGEEVRRELRELLGPRLVERELLGSAGRRELYGRAEALVLPSRDEGFGLISIEGAAVGAKLLLSDIPPFREILPEAVTFSLGDGGASLRHAFAQLRGSRNNAEDYSAKLETAARRFTWARTAAKYLEVYSAVSGMR